MRRKNRKWVAIAVGLYLLVMVSAYRWSVNQRLPGEDSLFIKIQREGVRKLAEEKAKAAQATPQPQPTGESRLAAAGPAYVAARYDGAHVVFIVAAETESRFASSPLMRSGTPVKVPAPAKLSAPLAELHELWEPDSQSLHFFPESVQKTKPGESWTLSVSPEATIPVIIDRVVVAPTGCSLALGFLATVPPEHRLAFAASGREYFAVRRTGVESADPPVASRIAELPHGKLFPAIAQQIEQQLTERMKQELSKIDARLQANAGTPGETAGRTVGDARPRTKEWIHADQGLLRGEGKLDYDFRGFRLTPDGAPRLFVRARWTLSGTPVFLMTAWFRADVPNPEERKAQADGGPARGTGVSVVLLSADSSWSKSLRESDVAVFIGDTLEFQAILNEFDADHDGWAELLVYSDHGDSIELAPYLYTDMGLAPLKTPLRRDVVSLDACLDP